MRQPFLMSQCWHQLVFLFLNFGHGIHTTACRAGSPFISDHSVFSRLEWLALTLWGNLRSAPKLRSKLPQWMQCIPMGPVLVPDFPQLLQPIRSSNVDCLVIVFLPRVPARVWASSVSSLGPGGSESGRAPISLSVALRLFLSLAHLHWLRAEPPRTEPFVDVICALRSH